MHAFLPFTLLLASLPIIHAAPKGWKTKTFTDIHGSGLEIWPNKRRAVIPAQATALPDAPIAFAAIPTHVPIVVVKREAEAEAEAEADAALLFNIPVPVAGSSPSSPEPTAVVKRGFFNSIANTFKDTGKKIANAAEAAASISSKSTATIAVKREANADANPEPDTIHSLAFNPMPDFKADIGGGSGEAKRDAAPDAAPDADAEADPQVLPAALNFPPMPNHKLEDGGSSN